MFGFDYFFVVGDWLVVLGLFLAGIGVIISGEDGGVEFGDGREYDGDEGIETGDVILGDNNGCECFLFNLGLSCLHTGFGVDLSLPSKLKWRSLGIFKPDFCRTFVDTENCFGVGFPQLLKPKLKVRFLLFVVSGAADFGTMGTK